MYIYCTLSSDQKINFFKKRSGIQHLEDTIYINGKANIADKFGITSAYGVTEITDKKLEQLETNVTFQRFVKAGHIPLSQSDRHAAKAMK